jgi:hypothetical protein
MPRAKQDEPTNALTAREHELLDTVVELEDRLAKLEGGQTAIESKGQTEAEKLTAEMDAEYAALAKEFAGFSGIDVLTRRVEHGVEASGEIRFKDDATDPTKREWRARWFNFSKEGRAWEAANRGWEKVRISDLQDPEAVTGGVQVDEYVRRGDRGQEVLMRMPEKLYRYVKKREQLAREGKLSSESSTQSYLANQVAALAAQTGDNADQAGSFVQGKGFQVDISEGQTERGQVPA